MSAVDSAGMRAGRLGFGVIELMVAVAIVAILTATALPSFREMGRRMTVTSTTNDLVGALAMARAEAAKRGGWVAVIGPGSNWSTGWHVEADAATPPNSPNHVFGDATDVEITQHAAVDSGYSVKVKVTNGNGGDARPMWPAAFRQVVSVAGLTADHRAAPWSSHGFWVDCSTVAEGICGPFVQGSESYEFTADPDTFPADSFALWSGTSFAAPQVAGAVAALMHEHGVGARRAYAMLRGTGRPVPDYGVALRILPGV